MTYIKNHPQKGKEFLDKVMGTAIAHNTVDENVKKSDILFSEDSTVVHISGNKESVGRILKVS